jgi:Ser/Thr protein kinase RdoA (MazF antagonist)
MSSASADCGFSWFFYDFATAVSFMEHEPVVAELRASWLDGDRAGFARR